MRHRLKGRKLSRTTAHRQMLARNLITSLLTYGRIITTVQKAKEFRGVADHLITIAKKGGLANYKAALAFLTDKKVAKKLFTDVAQRFKDRSSGYTRVVRLGGYRWQGKGHGKFAYNRLGDNAQRAIWELVELKDKEEELYLAGRGAKAKEEGLKKDLDKKQTKRSPETTKQKK